jgi:LCP family protein required for cell wall assembly
MAEKRNSRNNGSYSGEPQGGYYDGQNYGNGYYGEPQNYGNDAQNGYYNNGPQGYGNDPQNGYYNNGSQNYGNGYYDGPQGYGNGPQNGYYNGQPGYGNNAQGGYYNGPQNYGNGPQNGYYGDPQGYGAPQMDDSGKRRKKKKKHRKLRLAIEIIVLLVLALGIFAVAQLSRMDRVKLSDILVNSGIGQSGYRNIALFGVDSRTGELESGTNSDTIMVASINQKTGDVKLVSVYRDTYLDHTNGTYGKATECFSGGGAERAVNMLNKNLDLDIEDFVTVDFNGVIEAVDLLGGIELDITEEERGWLNGYLVETSQVTGVSYEEVASAGTQTVTGIQAMAYCRIRYTEGWDYKRTERQRTVLEKVFQKAKDKGVTGLLPLVNTMMDYISTSLSNTELLTLAAGIAKYNIEDTTGFPFEYQAADISAGDCVVPVNLAANVSELHEYLFGDSSYTVSDTVQEISNQIIWNTGIQ